MSFMMSLIQINFTIYVDVKIAKLELFAKPIKLQL